MTQLRTKKKVVPSISAGRKPASRRAIPQRGYAKRAIHERTILAAAEEVFALHGFKGTSLEEIAEKAGISKQNMLYYYPTKLGLYRQVLNEILDGWLGSLDVFTEEDADPSEALRAYVREKLSFSRMRPNASRIYAMEVIAGAPHFTREIKARVVPRTRRAALAFETFWPAKRGEKIDATHVVFLIWAATQTYADLSRQMELVLGRSLTEDDFSMAEELIVRMVLRTVDLDGALKGRHA